MPFTSYPGSASARASSSSSSGRPPTFIRHAQPEQVHRFNGMVNLLPDEPVGHLFARKVSDRTAAASPGEYWGLRPPIRWPGTLEYLYLPGVNAMHTRTACERVGEAVDVTLLHGSRDDALWYSQREAPMPVRLPSDCGGLCNEAPAPGR